MLRENQQLQRFVSLTQDTLAPYRIRALDGIHLAAAIIVQEAANRLTPPEPFVFVTADRQLVQVAQARNIPTDNPKDHP